MVTTYACISVPKGFHMAFARFWILVEIQSCWTSNAFQNRLVVILILRTCRAFLSVKHWTFVWAIYTFLLHDVVNFVLWAWCAHFCQIVKIIRMHASNTRIFSPKLICWTYAFFLSCTVNSSQSTAFASSCQIVIKLSIFAGYTFFSIEERHLRRTVNTFFLIHIINLIVGTKDTFSDFGIKISWMEACDTLISSPILFFWRANTFFDFLAVKSSQRTRLALKSWLIVISVGWALDTLIFLKEWEIFRTWKAFLYFNVVDLFFWAIFASFVWKIKEFRIETGNALFSCKIFFFRRTFALFRFFIINLLKWTFLTVFNWDIEVSIVPWALWAFFIHQNWTIFWTSPTLILINMIDMIFWTWLTFFGCIVEIIREVTCNTGFWSFKW